jgi:uncharacterized protein YjiS (DUF1127 family)
MYRIILLTSIPRLHRGRRKQSEVNRGASEANRVRANGPFGPRETSPEEKMTTLSPTAAQPGSQASPGGFVRWIERGAYVLLDYLERRAAIKTLRELDDRALKDIGLARCQIEAAVGGALNPEMPRLR